MKLRQSKCDEFGFIRLSKSTTVSPTANVEVLAPCRLSYAHFISILASIRFSRTAVWSNWSAFFSHAQYASALLLRKVGCSVTTGFGNGIGNPCTTSNGDIFVFPALVANKLIWIRGNMTSICLSSISSVEYFRKPSATRLIAISDRPLLRGAKAALDRESVTVVI